MWEISLLERGTAGNMENGAAKPDESALLMGYATKVEKALWETGGRINAVLLTQSVLSITILAVALGLSSYPSELSVVGLKVGLSLPTLLSGGAASAGCLLMYQLGLVHHEELLLRSVLDIYRTVGLEHESLSPSIAHPLENPGLVTTVIALSLKTSDARFSFQMARVFVLIVFLGLPLLAQIVVMWVLVTKHEEPWVLPVLLTFAITMWFVVLYFRRSIEDRTVSTGTR